MTGSTCALVSIKSSIAGSILAIPVGAFGGVGVWAFRDPIPSPAKKRHNTIKCFMGARSYKLDSSSRETYNCGLQAVKRCACSLSNLVRNVPLLTSLETAPELAVLHLQAAFLTFSAAPSRATS